MNRCTDCEHGIPLDRHSDELRREFHGGGTRARLVRASFQEKLTEILDMHNAEGHSHWGHDTASTLAAILDLIEQDVIGADETILEPRRRMNQVEGDKINRARNRLRSKMRRVIRGSKR